MANTASAARTLSTSVVKPQDMMFDSAKEKQINIDFPAVADMVCGWVPGRRVKIVGIRVRNGAVAQEAATNTTLIDVDIYNNDTAPDKQHDVAAKAAATAVAAEKWVDLTLSSTAADTVVEATESVRVFFDITGTQGACSVTISYVELTVGQLNVDFTA